MGLRQQLDDLVRDARSTPTETLAAATAMLESTAPADRDSLARLHHARGLAQRELGEMAQSGADLRAALALADELADEELWCSCALSLGATELYSGHVVEAIDLFRDAVNRTPDYATGPARFQLGSALAYAGQQEEALEHYAGALPRLRSSGAQDLEADLLTNRSVMLLEAGRFDDAIVDADAAITLFESNDNSMGAATVQHNKAIALFRQGELAEALQLFDRSGVALMDLGVPEAVLLTDKSEALLAGGFFDEAVRLSQDAAEHFAETGNEARRVEALVVGAEAALALEHAETAGRLAADALASPAVEELHGWHARAMLAGSRAEQLRDPENRSEIPGVDVDSLPALLESTGQGGRAMEARLVAVRQALLEERAAAAIELLDQQSESDLGRAPFQVLLERQALNAEASQQSNDPVRTMEAVHAGLDAIEVVQATTGSFEMRVHAARHADSLVRSAAEVLASAGRLDELVHLVERVRAGAIRAVAGEVAVDVDNPELADALVALRRAEHDDSPDVTQLRDQVRTLTRLGSATSTQPDVAVSAVAGGLRPDEGLFTFVMTRTRLLRVEHGGSASMLADCGDWQPVEALGRQLAFTGRQLARRSKLTARVRTQLHGRHRDLCARLAERLLPATVPERVIINAPPSLASLPWAGLGALTVTPHVLSPSVAVAHRVLPAERSSAAVGGSSVLPHVPAEVAAVSSIYGVAGLVDPDRHFVDQVGAATVAHLAGHFSRSSADPLFNRVELGGGDVSAHDVLAAPGAPAIAVLSACESGGATQVGESALGFGTALLAAGTRSVIVSQTLVEDGTATIDHMTALHHAISRGDGPACALADVRSRLDPSERALAASWLTLGAGW